MNNYEMDTIVAVSSPHGRGAIGVVRLSGERALEIAGNIFTDVRGRKVGSFAGRIVYHGRLVDDGRCIDEVLMFVMKKPRSFTGEDLVEISCHGNPIILGNVVGACVKKGARIAQPGEFTKRAFLNEKIDLTQAEAVAELISARSECAVSLAMANVNGRLKSQIAGLREGLLGILAGIEACIDFPEEDVTSESGIDAIYSIKKYINECNLIMRSSNGAKILKDGLRVVIVGKTNAGKSSLFNRLLNKDRSIVTSHQGTTRDIIEESVSMDGVSVVLVDTAGISVGGTEEIERESARRSREALMKADILLFVIDRSFHWSSQDREISELARLKSGIAVYNKSDLPASVKKDEIPEMISLWPSIEVSSLYGHGIEEVRSMIVKMYSNIFSHEELDSALFCNIRHSNSLKECRDALQRAVDAVSSGYHEEVIAVEMRKAVNSLGEITGEDSGDELINKIFSTFCIGK